jgi:hypothetical protein
MKTTPAFARPLLSALVALAVLTPVSRTVAETVVITSDTTITQGAYRTVSGTLAYQIADGATLKLAYDPTAAATQTVGPLYPAANASILIGPSGTDATGRFMMENLNLTNGSAGFASISSGATNVRVDVTNATFRNIRTKNNGGLVFINNASALHVFFKNTLFENISTADGDGGVVRMFRNASSANLVSVTSGTFLNNYAPGNFGVLDVSGTVLMTDVLFSGNRTGGFGGVIGANSGSYLTEIVLTDVIFKDNWSGRQGGAIWGAQGNGRKLIIKTTGSGGVTNYEYTGNYTLGLAANATAAELSSGAPATLTPSAALGGFYYATTTGTLVFDLAASTTLAIGSGGGLHEIGRASWRDRW